MKKEYFKPEIRFVAMSKSPFMTMSPVVIGGTNLNGEDESEELIPTGNSNTNTGNPSRFGFWEDFDEDLLEDVEDINDLN